MRHRSYLLTLSLPLALLAVSPAIAQSDATPASQNAPAAVQAEVDGTTAAYPGPIVKTVRHGGEAPSMRGLIAVRDAETGNFRAPTDAEWQRLASTVSPLNRSDAGLEEIHYADGTVGVRLDGRFQSMTMAQKPAGQDTPHSSCTHSAQVAADIILAPPAMAQEAADRHEEASDVR